MDKKYIEAHVNQPLILDTCKAILENAFADDGLKKRAIDYIAYYNTDMAFETTRKLLSAAVRYRMTNKQAADVLEVQAMLDNFDPKLAVLYAKRARELDAQGVVYCDCPACSACTRILELK